MICFPHLQRIGFAVLLVVFPAVFAHAAAPLTLKATEAPKKQAEEPPKVVTPRPQGAFGVKQVDPLRKDETPQNVEKRPNVFQELLDRQVVLPTKKRPPAPPKKTTRINPFEEAEDWGSSFGEARNPFEDAEMENPFGGNSFSGGSRNPFEDADKGENPFSGFSSNPSNPFAAGDPFADEDPRNQVQNLPQAGNGFVTPDEMQFTHLVTFAPKGGFAPGTPRELLQELNEPLFKTSIKTGYFRTAPIGGKLVGAICTHDPAGLQKVIESTETLEFIKAERLTQKMFETHEKPLLPQADGGFVTPDNMRYTHLVAFGPKGGFAPGTPNELLNELNEPLFKTDIKTGYFRTRPVDGKLMGVICTHDPAGLQKVIESTKTLEFIKADRLTQGMFEALEKMP